MRFSSQKSREINVQTFTHSKCVGVFPRSVHIEDVLHFPPNSPSRLKIRISFLIFFVRNVSAHGKAQTQNLPDLGHRGVTFRQACSALLILKERSNCHEIHPSDLKYHLLSCQFLSGAFSSTGSPSPEICQTLAHNWYVPQIGRVLFWPTGGAR